MASQAGRPTRPVSYSVENGVDNALRIGVLGSACAYAHRPAPPSAWGLQLVVWGNSSGYGYGHNGPHREPAAPCRGGCGTTAGLRVHVTVMLRAPYPQALACAASYTFSTHPLADVRTTGTLVCGEPGSLRMVCADAAGSELSLTHNDRPVVWRRRPVRADPHKPAHSAASHRRRVTRSRLFTLCISNAGTGQGASRRPGQHGGGHRPKGRDLSRQQLQQLSQLSPTAICRRRNFMHPSKFKSNHIRSPQMPHLSFCLSLPGPVLSDEAVAD